MAEQRKTHMTSHGALGISQHRLPASKSHSLSYVATTVRAPEWSNKCSSITASKWGCMGTDIRLRHSSGRSRWAVAMRKIKNTNDLCISYAACQISIVSEIIPVMTKC